MSLAQEYSNVDIRVSFFYTEFSWVIHLIVPHPNVLVDNTSGPTNRSSVSNDCHFTYMCYYIWNRISSGTFVGDSGTSQFFWRPGQFDMLDVFQNGDLFLHELSALDSSATCPSFVFRQKSQHRPFPRTKQPYQRIDPSVSRYTPWNLVSRIGLDHDHIPAPRRQ